MERGLVVLQETEWTNSLLREAGEYADAVNAELLVLSFLSEAEYGADVEALTSIGDVENVSYDERAVLDGVEREVATVASEAFGDQSVDYDSIVTVADGDEYADRALEAAEQHDCDHIFVAGRRRSPTGKALFGDQVQRIILDFDGFVTVTTA